MSEAAAFDAYHRTRSRLSDTLFTATDDLAAYDWNLAELPQLLVALARAMKEEVDALMKPRCAARGDSGLMKGRR